MNGGPQVFITIGKGSEKTALLTLKITKLQKQILKSIYFISIKGLISNIIYSWSRTRESKEKGKILLSFQHENRNQPGVPRSSITVNRKYW